MFQNIHTSTVNKQKNSKKDYVSPDIKILSQPNGTVRIGEMKMPYGIYQGSIHSVLAIQTGRSCLAGKVGHAKKHKACLIISKIKSFFYIK